MEDVSRIEKTEGVLPPHPTLRQCYRVDDERPGYIQTLFDASARHYDWLSALMSFGTDRRYRGDVLRRHGLTPGMAMLDVACGTGLVSVPARRIVGSSGMVVSLDPSPGMLSRAVERGRADLPVLGTAENLPLKSDRFDLLCMGFALRHVEDLYAAFSEYKRVLKPGGKVLILDMTLPPSRRAYPFIKFYLNSFVPFLARVSTFNNQATHLLKYFWDTVDQCVPPEAILGALRDVGFEQVDRKVEAKVFSEYTAIKP